MRIQFFGHEFDLFDNGARAVACAQYAEQLVHMVVEDSAEPVADIMGAFHELLTQLTSYWLMSGATLNAAKAAGATGISMDQALEMHNFIGPLVGQKEMAVEVVKPKPSLEGSDAE